MRVGLVTDSTAQLSLDTAARRDITVIPLNVVIDEETYEEGPHGASADFVAQSLRERRAVSTSRPVPTTFEEAYARLAAAGVDEIVSVHISGEMSGTVESAQVAARTASVPVHVVDSGQVGPATGFAVLSAADVRDAGGTGEEMASAASARAAAASSLFYVDTLDYLRRGGRIGTAAALLGSALAVKPLLTITDGKVASLERVRTSSKALARLADLAVREAGDRSVEVVVAHLANAERAQALSLDLQTRLAAGLEGREVIESEVSAVLGAHVGPGMVAVCVAPLV